MTAGMELQRQEIKKAKWRCGKCRGGPVYRDDDTVAKVAFLVCMQCGNRYPGGTKPIFIEPEPYQLAVNFDYKPPNLLLDSNRFKLVNALRVPFVEERPEEEEKPVEQIEPKPESTKQKIKRIGSQVEVGYCRNCERNGVKICIAHKRCHQCNYHLRKGVRSLPTDMRDDPTERAKILLEAKQLFGKMKPGEQLRRGPKFGTKFVKKKAVVLPHPEIIDQCSDSVSQSVDTRAGKAGLAMADSIIEMVNLMYQLNTVKHFYKAMIHRLKEHYAGEVLDKIISEKR